MFRSLDSRLALVLLLLGLCAQGLLRWVLELELPMGLDMDMWVMAVHDAATWHEVPLFPLYPSASALLMSVTGSDGLTAAQRVSAAAVGLVPAAAFLLARVIGAGPWRALIAGLAALLFPGVVAFGVLVGPDGLTTLVLLLAAAAAALLVSRPGWASCAAFALALGLLGLVREHGVIALVLGLAVPLMAPDRATRRAAYLVIVAAVALAAPLLLGQRPALPGMTAWSARMMLPLRELIQGSSDLTDRFPVGEQDLGVLHPLVYALTRATIGWIWVLLGGLAATRAPRALRAALLVGMVPALAGLVVLSEPRHVWVVVPVCMAAWLAAPRRRHAEAILVGLVVVVLAQTRWVPYVAAVGRDRGWRAQYSVSSELSRLQESSEALASQGRAICALAGEGDLWSGKSKAFAFCPLRQHRASDKPTAANLHCWHAGDEPPGELWRRVNQPGIHMSIYRYLWSGPDAERPCADARPVPETPFRARQVRPARMVPACRVDPSLVEAWGQ